MQGFSPGFSLSASFRRLRLLCLRLPGLRLPLTALQRGRGPCLSILQLSFLQFFILSVVLLLPQSLLGEFSPEYREAVKLYAVARYRDSLEKIRLVFDRSPNSLELRLLAAANYKMLKEYNLARAHIAMALKEHPQRLEPYALKAALQRRQGRYWSAISTAQKGVQVFGEKAPLRLEIASAYYSMNRFVRARLHLQKVLELEPHNFYATYLDGLIFLKQGRYELAEFRLRNALELEIEEAEDLADLYNNLGVVLERRAWQYRKAKNFAEFNRALKEALRYYNFSLAVKPEGIVAKNNQSRLQIQ